MSTGGVPMSFPYRKLSINGFPKAAHMNFATHMLLERLLGQTAIQCPVDPGIEPATSGTAVQRCYHLTTEALETNILSIYTN